MRQIDEVLIEEIVTSIRMLRAELKELSTETTGHSQRIVALETKLIHLETKMQEIITDGKESAKFQHITIGARRTILWVIGFLLALASSIAAVLKFS